MKRYLVILGFGCMALCLASCGNDSGNESTNEVTTDLVKNPVTASGEKTKSNLPVMEFEQTSHDFGMIVQGEKVSHTFKFTNTGGSNLVISQASSTCGCTVPNFSKRPIKPGAKGTIEVVFNSAGRSGSNTKSVRILSNAQPNSVELEITAEIYVPEKK